MRTWVKFLFLVACAALPQTFAAALPTITYVQNAASNIPQGLPNAGIAQGSIFILKGSNLGPPDYVVAPSAEIFQSTLLGGTSVSVQVGSTTVNALMYYTSASQVAALLPSSTPVGNGMISVTYRIGGATLIGAGFPITVVANNVGVFSLDSSGQGPAIVTDAYYSLISSAPGTGAFAETCPAGQACPNTEKGAANPGDTLILWATGLGPVNGSDASGAGLGVAINVPLTLWLGGVKASVGYQGRSGCCIGEDQIVFTVPDNVPTGCAVPLAVQAGAGSNIEVSNVTVLPIAPVGTRNCTPTNPAAAAQNVEATLLNGPLNYGSIVLSRVLGNAGTVDQAQIQFTRFLSYTSSATQASFISFIDDPPPGACLVYNNLSPANSLPISVSAKLDAGNTVNFTGPAGNVSGKIAVGGGTVILDPNGDYLYEGAYTASDSGGGDVGKFTANLSLPGLPQLSSPSPSNPPPVTRSSGLTVTWNPNNQGGIILVQVVSATDSTYTTGATVSCEAPTSAGTLTIPGFDLLTLPAGSSAYLSFEQVTPQAPFTALGLNFTEIYAISAPSGPSLTLQ